jgi:hypothetical protein
MDTFRRLRPLSLSLRPNPSRRRLPRTFVQALFLSALPGIASVLSLPTAAAAQEYGALKGVVSTADKRPLADARISVTGTTLVAVADTDGSFRIAALPLGSQRVEVKLLGYASILLPVTIEAARTATLQVTLTPAPLALETVNISGDTLIIPAMQGFLDRKKRGNGTFFTREEIERMQPRLFTDILRRVPGMQLQLVSGPNNNGYVVRTGRTGEGIQGGRQCPVLFYMNGMPFPMTADGVINSFISPEEVEAIEVYAGASQIPAQFNATAYNARCGVVVIWTLNGRESRRSH